jgi:hypothetical protein
MGQERLSGLALLNMHRYIDVNIDEFINIFGNNRNRKLDFLLK